MHAGPEIEEARWENLVLTNERFPATKAVCQRSKNFFNFLYTTLRKSKKVLPYRLWHSSLLGGNSRYRRRAVLSLAVLPGVKINFQL